MEPIFIDHGQDGRHFGDLVADRVRVIAGEGIAAPAALGRLTVDDLAELLGGYEWAGLAMMAGLPTPLLARGGGRRPSLDRGGIGGGGSEELAEFLPSCSSRSAIGSSKDRTRPETAAGTSGESVSQRVCGSGGRAIMPLFCRTQAAAATWGHEPLLTRQVI
jgi:hypothetical protein